MTTIIVLPPWQMTLAEASSRGCIVFDISTQKYRIILATMTPGTAAANASMHAQAVMDAITRGEPVPPAVLADYPLLTERTEFYGVGGVA